VLKVGAFTVTFAVVGIEVTMAGLTLQLPVPDTREHDKLMLPVNPLVAVTLIGPVVALLPTLTVGKAVGSLSVKSGLLLRTWSTALA
jgi:hypothetical protein